MFKEDLLQKCRAISHQKNQWQTLEKISLNTGKIFYQIHPQIMILNSQKKHTLTIERFFLELIKTIYSNIILELNRV